ncbi:MAG: hypothetical protein ACJ72E_03195 [Marmoricola sp.]
MRVGLQRLPVLVGVGLAVLLSGVLRQVRHPFLEHDDWGFLLPVTEQRTAQMHDRLLWEGRWFNYGWWRVIGHLFSPAAVSVLFTIGVLGLAAVVALRWASGWFVVPTVVALAASPMLGDLSSWPATLAASMVLLAVAALALPHCVGDPRRLSAWTVVSTLLIFLAYPPFTLILLVLLGAELAQRTLRELVVGVAVFCASYVAGTLVSFSLNALVLGHFGVKVLPWRRPHPVHGIGDLLENLRRAADQLGELLGTYTIPLVLGLLALLACWVLPHLRERTLRFAAVLVVALGIQASATVLTGVFTPSRATGWLWFVVVLPLVWLFENGAAPAARPAKRWTSLGAPVALVALVALVVVCGWGARYWHRAMDDDQHQREVLQRVLDSLERNAAAHPGDRVVVFGSSQDWRSSQFAAEAQYLTDKASHDHGLSLTSCRPPVCDVALRPSVLARADRGARSFVSTQFVIVVPPAHKDSLAH